MLDHGIVSCKHYIPPSLSHWQFHYTFLSFHLSSNSSILPPFLPSSFPLAFSLPLSVHHSVPLSIPLSLSLSPSLLMSFYINHCLYTSPEAPYLPALLHTQSHCRYSPQKPYHPHDIPLPIITYISSLHQNPFHPLTHTRVPQW